MNSADVSVEWYSGSGSGGQHRNKHQNCCRLTHLPTGLRAVGTAHRERRGNILDATRRLAMKVAAASRIPEERRRGDHVVRTYHLERGEALDHSTGIRAPAPGVLDGDLDAMLRHPERGRTERRTGRV